MNLKNLSNGTNQTIKKSLFQKEEEDEMELYWSMPYKQKEVCITEVENTIIKSCEGRREREREKMKQRRKAKACVYVYGICFQ